jgi:ankyrin repeat protein
LLLSGGANVNLLDIHGWSPLYAACISRNPKMFKLLLYGGANIDDNVLRCIADKPEFQTILKEWRVIMGVEALRANAVYLDGNIVEELNNFIGGRKRNKKSKKRRKTIRKKRKSFKK